MKVLVDADACPVTDLVIAAAKARCVSRGVRAAARQCAGGIREKGRPFGRPFILLYRVVLHPAGLLRETSRP